MLWPRTCGFSRSIIRARMRCHSRLRSAAQESVMHDRWGCMRWRHASVRVHGTRSFRWGSVTAGPTARTLALREDGGGDVQSGFKGRGGFVVAMLCSGVGGLQGHQLRPCRGHLCLPLMDSSLRLSSLTLQLFANFKNSSPTTTPDASCDAQHWSVAVSYTHLTLPTNREV